VASLHHPLSGESCIVAMVAGTGVRVCVAHSEGIREAFESRVPEIVVPPHPEHAVRHVASTVVTCLMLVRS
jgi:hypothetical protein